ncbi:hypothetical protein FRC06_003302 [Ceratobasidium sp. 370]|nr:hypothetical protein FRC06_003302 [Ceratobasidium sp. 370]
MQQKLHKLRETKFDLAQTLVKGPGFASFIFVLVGLCSAVSGWAPYALLGEAIAAEQQGGRVHDTTPNGEFDDLNMALLAETDDWENVERASQPPPPAEQHTPQQSGVILGIHNIFIVIPQFVIIGVSSAVFALLDTQQLLHPGGKSSSSESLPPGKQSESIGVVFRQVIAIRGALIGGICSGIAAVLTLQLAKSLQKKYSAA